MALTARPAKFWRWLARERQFCALCYAEGKRTQLATMADYPRLGPAVYASTLRRKLIAHVAEVHPAMLAKVSAT